MDKKPLYDNRELYDYETRYPNSEINKSYPSKQQRKEAIYLGAVLLFSFLLILLNYLDILYRIVCLANNNISYMLCKKIFYCAFFGLLGGVTFDIKFFYRSVARGFWNEDRIYWRIFMPWLSIALALVMLAVLNKTVLEANTSMSICIGFFSGYFSDDAIAKMHDVAQVVFSTTKSNIKDNSYDNSMENKND